MEAAEKRGPDMRSGPGNELNEFTIDFTDLRSESPAQSLEEWVKADLAKSGLTPETFPIEPSPGGDFEGYKILYPNAPAFNRLKLRRPKEGGPKYLSAKGSGNQPYLSPPVQKELENENSTEPIFIVEGEKKAAKATLDGFPTVGLTGVDGWRDKRSGQSEFLPELETLHWEGRKVYVVYDSDRADNYSVLRAERSLAIELTRRGAEVFIVSLPSEVDGEKNGLDDYLKRHGRENFRRLIAHARPAHKVHDIQEYDLAGTDPEAGCIALADHAPEPVSWIIEGLIPDCFPSIIFAREGIGKSFLAALLAIEACQGGGSFLGHNYSEGPLNALYVDYEMSAGIHYERAVKIARGLGLPGIPRNFFYFAPDVPVMEALPKIGRLIKLHGIKFLIVDSWTAAGLDAFDPKVAADYFAGMRSLGVASLTIDHEKKSQSGTDSGNDSFYGGVHKLTQSRSAFRLTRIGEGQSPVGLRLRQIKNSFGARAEDMAFDVSFEGDKVLFTQSDAPNPEERDLELIAGAIAELGADGAKVNQKALAEHFEGVIGQKRLRLLLEKGDGELWETHPGERTEKTYKLRTAERQYYRGCHSAVLENPTESVEDGDYPEVLNG